MYGNPEHGSGDGSVLLFHFTYASTGGWGECCPSNERVNIIKVKELLGCAIFTALYKLS